MNTQGLQILIIGFVTILLSACGGETTKPTISIPVIKLSDIHKSGKYFHANKFYYDKALRPFSSIPSVITNLSGQAAANGSKAFLVTKSYEKYAKGTILNGIHAFVEGWGITWKPANKKILLADLKKFVDEKGGGPVIQSQFMITHLISKKIKEALPLLREAMNIRRIHRSTQNLLVSAYFNLGDASQNNQYVKMIKSYSGGTRYSAIQALSRFGTKEHKPIFLKILRSGNKQNGSRFAAEGLLKVGNKNDINDWKKFLHFHPDNDVKIIAAKVLLKYSQRNEVVKLAKNTHDSYLKNNLESILLK